VSSPLSKSPFNSVIKFECDNAQVENPYEGGRNYIFKYLTKDPAKDDARAAFY
jgi:hypothetical protein